MSPVALYFASGESLYLGAALLLAAWAVPRRWPMLRSLSSWLGLILMVMACPPISWYAYAVLVCVFLLWLFSPAEPKLRSIAVTALLIVVVAVIVGSEFFHRGLPLVTGPRDDHVVIVGDSLSSGLGQAPPWPVFLQRATGIQVKNLARAGAGVNDALAMANQITSADHLVLLEIGGNDLLAGVPADRFAMGLEALLMQVCASGRTVVMFELPLIPSRIGYGQAQRRLAAKYHVVLIPKRFLAGVLGPSSTSDGLHLSESGAQQMAALVARVAFSRPCRDLSCRSSHPALKRRGIGNRPFGTSPFAHILG